MATTKNLPEAVVGLTNAKAADLRGLPANIRSKLIEFKILLLVTDHPADLTRIAAERLGVTRQTAHKYIRRLVSRGALEAIGNTRSRTYRLKSLVSYSRKYAVTPDLEEDRIWREFTLPIINNIPPNVRDICYYGFTEMVNNVIDHSGANKMTVSIEQDALYTNIYVLDNGIGIFKKIQEAFHYEDARHALLELSKGKLTTDPRNHSGEGIYFSSRMFDEFIIMSGDLFYRKRSTAEDGWLIEVFDREPIDGTTIMMKILTTSDRQLDQVFSDSSIADDYSFAKTHVPICLAKYGTERLVSRSQAKRVLSRFERFSEIMLDFKGVERIGQAFSDEIFRVFVRENPSIRVIWINANPEVERMIRRAQSSQPVDSADGAN